MEYATVSRLVSFWAVGGKSKTGHPPTTVKAPSRRGERKNRREATTPRKSLFLIWDEDIGRMVARGVGREGLGLVPSSSFREKLASGTSSMYPIERKRRSSYTPPRILRLDFGKSFRCNFDGTSFHFSSRATTSGRRDQRGSLLRDLGIPSSRSSYNHCYYYYLQRRQTIATFDHLIETDERSPINSTSNLAPQETVGSASHLRRVTP